MLAKHDYCVLDEFTRGFLDCVGEGRLRGGGGGNCVGDFPVFQFFAENGLDLLADAVHALVGENRLVNVGKESRGLTRSLLRYSEGAILLVFVEFNIRARISLRDLKEYSSLRKLCRNISKLFNNFVLSAVEGIKLGIPTGVGAPLGMG